MENNILEYLEEARKPYSLSVHENRIKVKYNHHSVLGWVVEELIEDGHEFRVFSCGQFLTMKAAIKTQDRWIGEENYPRQIVSVECLTPVV